MDQPEEFQSDTGDLTAPMITPIILCGGSGTRLWPLSRRDHAKQHVPILSGASPFQRTLKRVASMPGLGRPLVLTGADGRFMAAEQAEATGVEADIVIEPAARDTLAAIAIAATLVARREPEGHMLVLPSDHLIPESDLAAFSATIAQAVEAAARGRLVVFGLKPDSPSTAYGYIRPADGAGGTRDVAAFVEKPDAAHAHELIEEGCLWNSGMFCFRADVALSEITEHAPTVAAIVAQAVEEATDDLGALRLGAGLVQAEKISFDYAVMERTMRATVVDAEFAWSDIGDWREIWRHADRDECDNAIEGDAMLHDAQGCYVHASDRLVCALGVQGLAIVDTPDALLIAPLERTQEVKGMVSALAAAGRPEADTSARVYRPWGWYQTMDLGDRFRVKRIQVSPGKQLSLQRHHHRAEHWVVVKGTAEVLCDGTTSFIRENESIYLPLGAAHRLSNPGRIPVEIIEVQTGSYLEEDDIIRLEDDFGRS